MKKKISFLTFLFILISTIGTFTFNTTASELPKLTKEQREEYYQEYLRIVEELREDFPEESNIYISPFDEIKDNDWINPEQFREKIMPFISEDKGIIELPFVYIEVTAPTKYKQITLDNGTSLGTVIIDSTLLLSYDSKLQSPIIKDIYNVNSYTMTGLSYWSQASYRRANINYDLFITGHLFKNDQTFPDALIVSYAFNNEGFIE